MQVDGYVESITRQLALSADAGGDEARRVAERLVAPLESAIRLALLDALSAAAAELTVELAPGAVELRLRGGEPSFVVTPAAEAAPDRADEPGPTDVGEADVEGGPSSRINLRLPDALKARVEEAAAREGRSVNSWLVRAAATALTYTPDVGPPAAGARRSQNRITGWVR